MPLRFPPRREPRVLAIARALDGFSFAVADPWEVRSAGTIRCRIPSRRAALDQLVRREKPTAIAAYDRKLRSLAVRAARRHGIGLVGGRLPRLPSAIAADLYRELPLRAPTPSLAATARLAIAAVLYAESTHRTYAPRRHRPTEHAA